MSKILIIDQFWPMPDRNSGGRRLSEIIKLMLSEGHEVTFAPVNKLLGGDLYGHQLDDLGVRTVTAPHPCYFTPEVLREKLSNERFDVVVLCFYPLAITFLDTCRELFSDAKHVIDTVDLHFVRELRQAELAGNQIAINSAMQTRRAELGIYTKADALWAITPVEQEVLRREVAVPEVNVIPNIHDIGPKGFSYSQRHGLLFVGNFFHPPNAEGLGWFCNEVLPIVRSQIPDIKTTVVGANAPEYFNQFADKGVYMADHVPDLTLLLAQSRVSIAPLLHGAGMKGKVGEALAHGLPVVTTSIGAEGIGLNHSIDALVADSAHAFASAIALAYQSAEVWNMLATNGHAFMSRFTPAAVRESLREALRTAPKIQYLALPNWNDEVTVKRVVDAYIRKHQGSNDASLSLLLLNVDAEFAGSLVSRWIGELGYDIETIPDIALTPITASQLASVCEAIWVPMSRSVEKPPLLQEVETFCPIAVTA